MLRIPSIVVAGLLLVVLPSCGDSSSEGSSDTTTIAARLSAIRVPADKPTIQEAVDGAKEGDLILVAKGTYKESVSVETKNLVIRGEDRNDTIIDGEFTRENGIKVFSDGVAVENLTVKNHTSNGIFFTGDYGKGVTLHGYRASYITASNNGLYGVYAFSAEDGMIDHSYGSGHPDSAFYVGQCQNCNALLTDNVAENNMLGYSGTNSTGVTIVNSTFSHNRAGIVPNSLYSEQFGPNSGTTIVGNIVDDNNNPEAPDNKSFSTAYGNGIVIGGGSKIIVERNLVTGNKNAGIVVTDLPTSKDPADGQEKAFKPENNQVRGNVLTGNQYDLAYLTATFASNTFGNCFEQNDFSTSFPADLEKKMTCSTDPGTDLGDLAGILTSLIPSPPDIDYRKVTAPPRLDGMADPLTAPARPGAAPPAVDVAAIVAPAKK